MAFVIARRSFALAVLTILFAIFSGAECSWAADPLRADLIIVEKKQRKLTLSFHGKPVKEYSVALGPNPEGKKTQQGDGKTPEGRYIIDRRNPQSHYWKSLHISYPNSQDSAQARRRGVSPGGDVFVHGIGKKFGFLGARHRLSDWTLGCIAVTNEEIEEIWKAVPDGTPIEIRP